MTGTEKNRFSKPVAFNKSKPIDQKILMHLKKKKNFSGYVKKLILEDIKAKELAKGILNEEEVKEVPVRETVQLSISERLEQLKKAGNPARLSNKNVD